jgi:flagellar assembly protein FliH
MGKIIKQPEISKDFYILKTILKELLEKQDIHLQEEEIQEIAEEIYNETSLKNEKNNIDEILNKKKDKIKNLEKKEDELKKNQQELIKNIKKDEEKLNKVQQEIKINQQKLNNVKKEISKIEKQGYEKGFSIGKNEGIDLGKKEVEAKFIFADEMIEDAKKKIEDIINKTLVMREEIIKNSEQDIVKLSLSIAKKVINEEVKLNPDIVVSIAKQAMNKVIDRDKVIIKVNPKDYNLIRKYKQDFLSIREGIKDFDIMQDSSIEQGGVLIETPSGNVDARIPKQIEEVEKGFEI